MELITLNDIYKTYYIGDISVPVLKGISLAVARGELVALMDLVTGETGEPEWQPKKVFFS